VEFGSIALPPVPSGQTPGGAWLLYSYLQFAEQLGGLYKQSAVEGDRVSATGESTTTNGDTASRIPRPLPPHVTVHSPRLASLPSRFAESLANTLAASQHLGSHVHWGNDGFCIDLALAHPLRPDGVTIGLLVDSNRYLQAPDPVEWDLFRAAIHESQGWKLHRVWTPQFFRDPQTHLAAIAAEVQKHLAQEKPHDALGVVH